MSYWETIVTDYFLPRATFKFTLWKDNQRMEAKPFGMLIALRWLDYHADRTYLFLQKSVFLFSLDFFL